MLKKDFFGLPPFLGSSTHERIPLSCTPSSTGVCGLMQPA
jgi:hypothetical protein